ncbi:hypothetical protein MJG53_017583 [Ovis ammon polii x Ovis aries]|uniref:Uncharacterized protein n=2 Tax=Ovis TaxID=9935 RepID=A0A836CSI0_SHEEP|nr:hypothetical protein JEQ12_010744 [Ovis aries]KAI4560954.1 hypothetical protein MJG53_017583 [Ovis ammon polii x Ovis aries]
MDSKVSVGKRKSIMDGILKKGLGIVYNSKCKTDARWTAAAETVPGPDVRQTWETNSIAEATSRGGEYPRGSPPLRDSQMTLAYLNTIVTIQHTHLYGENKFIPSLKDQYLGIVEFIEILSSRNLDKKGSSQSAGHDFSSSEISQDSHLSPPAASAPAEDFVMQQAPLTQSPVLTCPGLSPSSPASHQSGTPLPTPNSGRHNVPVISRFKF